MFMACSFTMGTCAITSLKAWFDCIYCEDASQNGCWLITKSHAQIINADKYTHNQYKLNHLDAGGRKLAGIRDVDDVEGAQAVAVGPHRLQLGDGVDVHRTRPNWHLSDHLPAKGQGRAITCQRAEWCRAGALEATGSAGIADAKWLKEIQPSWHLL
jgi:hypothetical protein